MSTRTRTIALIACAGVALTLPFAGTAAAKTKDGCEAVTTEQINAELSAIAGGEAAEGEPTEFEGYTSCTWTFPNSIAFIGLNKVNKENKADFKERSKAPGVEKVPGLKKSFYESELESGNGGNVTFIDGTTFVNFQYFTTDPIADPEAVKDALTTLSKQAAKKL